MTPWLLLSVLTALVNLFAFVLVRGRWGSIVPLLGVASLVGTVAGNAIGQRLSVDLLRIGEFRFLAASVVAQLAMLLLLLLSTLAPTRIEEPPE